MKKLKLLFIVCAGLIFSSCGSSQEYSYVKNVFFSTENESYKVVFQVYDFESAKENYRFDSFSFDDLDNLLISATAYENYNFRLCENVLIDINLFDTALDNVLSSINWLKIPPATNILCFLDSEIPDNLSLSGVIDTPLYSLSQEKSGFLGIIQITDKSGKNKGAVIVDNGRRQKAVSEKQWKMVNLLKGNNAGFTFTTEENNIFIQADWCDVYFSADKKININILLSIKDYKGVENTAQGMEKLQKILRKEISYIIVGLYEDEYIKESCNLDWYESINKTEIPGVVINIDFI